MSHRNSRTMWVRVALCAALPLLWAALSLAGPAGAQTNSPSGGQPTGDAPSQGGPSGETGSNVGGGGEVGNRTTPGGAGATGGGSSGAGEADTAEGGTAGAVFGVVALLAVVAVGVAIFTRHRRVMEDADEGAASARR